MKKVLIGLIFVCTAAYGATQWGNFSVKGNLSVTGTQTQTGVATFTAAPIFSALTAMTVPYLDASKVLTSSTATPTQLTYLANATSNLCGISQACTLSNKDINFGTATNSVRLLLPTETTTNLDGLTDTAGLLAYDTTQGKPVYNNGSAWTAVGSGTGGTNEASEYITEGKFETDSTGWSTYADAAATSPVDCTGGSPNVTIARTTTAGEILRGSASLEMVKDAANRQGEGFSYDFTIDPKNHTNLEPVYLSFDYNATTNYASSDIKFFVYDKDAAALLSVQDLSALSGALPASTGGARFTGVFYPTTSTSNDYRLCAHQSSTSALAYDFHLDSVHAGGQVTIPGAIISEWVSYTGCWQASTSVTIGNGTETCRWRRVGDSMEIGFYLAAGTTTSGSGTYRIGLPSGYTLDTTKGAALISAQNVNMGNATFHDTGTAIYLGSVAYSSSTYVELRYWASSGASVNGPAAWTNTAPMTLANGDEVFAQFKVPITNWQPSASLSTNEMLLSTVKAVYKSNAGQSFNNGSETIVDYEDKVYDPYNTVTTGASWKFTAPKTACYRVSAYNNFTSSGAWGAGELALNRIYKNGASNGTFKVWTAESATTQLASLDLNQILCLTKSDYFDIRLQQNSGGALALESTDLYNHIAIEELPDFSVFSAITPVVTTWDFQSWTPTGAWSSNTTYTGKWRRVGDTGEYQVKVQVSGAPTSATLSVNLPSGHVIDTNKLLIGTENEQLGIATIFDNGTAFYTGIVEIGTTSSTVKVRYSSVSGSLIALNSDVTQAAPMTWASGDYVHMIFRVPIVGW